MNLKNSAFAVLLFFCIVTLPAFASDIQPTDYSKPEHWLSLPSAADKRVDVFYLYPTVYQKANPNDPNICAVDNPVMVKNSKLALAFQASAFNPIGNIYAPYYRQADAAYTLNLPLAEQEKVIGGMPASDALAAFDYFIKNYNKGRPFILAGHSQGSNLLLYLLSDYMKNNPEVYGRMIVAYVIGYSITPDYLAKNPHLKFAQDQNDLGVIVSYNTEAPNMTGKNPVVLPGALAINPISWSLGEELAPASESLGSIDMDASGKMVTYQNYADARVDKAKGVVICASVDVDKLSPGNAVFPKGIYHHYDYLFYYYNIRDNADNRTELFLNKP